MAIPGNAETLEKLLIEVVGDDTNLKQFLDDAVKAAETAAKAMRESLNLDWSKVTQGAQATATAFDQVAPAVRDVNSTFDQFVSGSQRAFDDVRRAGRMTTEQFEAYRKTALEAIETQRPLAQSLGYTGRALDDLAKHVKEAAYEQSQAAQETERTKQEQEELEAVIKRLSNEVRSSRNVWAGRITSDEEFRQSTGAAREEMLKLLPTLDRSSVEYRKLSQELAYAQRGLDSVNKVASRGGLAWTSQIALANQFGQSLRGLGPAGNAAAGALGLVQGSVVSLFQPVTMADVSFKNLAVSVGRFALVTAPLAAAVGAVAGLAGLAKLTTDAARLAQELENATHRTGLTVEGLQELQHAARQTGVPMELLSTTMQRLQRRAADANAGNAGLQQAFRQLGVTLTDENGKMRTTEDLLGQVADGLNRVESDADRLALAFKVFDTEGGRLLPLLTRGSEGIRELRQEARELGLVISGDAVMSLVELQEKLTTVKAQFDTLKMEVAAAFLPVFTQGVIPMLQDHLVPWLQNAADQLGVFASTLFSASEQGDQLRNRIATILEPLVSIAEVAISAGLGVYGGLLTINTAIKLLVNEVRIGLAHIQGAWHDMWDDFKSGGGGGLMSTDWFRNLFGMAPTGRTGASNEVIAALRAENDRIAAGYLDSFDAWADPIRDKLERVFTGGVHAGIVDGLESLISPSSPTAKALRETGDDLANLLGGGASGDGEADVAAAAKEWTTRLAAELRFGLKDVEQVIALLAPAIERQMAKASFALATGGVDSQDYKDAVARLTVLQGLWSTLGDGADYAGIMAARAFEDNPGLIALGDIPETAEDSTERLEELGEAAVKAGASFLTNLGESIRTVTQNLADATEEYRSAVALLGVYDAAQATAAQRTRDATNAVRLMLQQGRDWAEITAFAKQYGLTLEDVAVVARELGLAKTITLPDVTGGVRGANLTDMLTAFRALIPSVEEVGTKATETGQAFLRWFGPRAEAGINAVKAATEELARAEAYRLEQLAAARAQGAAQAQNYQTLAARIRALTDDGLTPAQRLLNEVTAEIMAGNIHIRDAAELYRLLAEARQAELDAVKERADQDEAARLAEEAAALAAATDGWEAQSQRITDFLQVEQSNLDHLRKAAKAAFDAGVIGAEEYAEALKVIAAIELHENLDILAQKLEGVQSLIPSFMADMVQAFAQFTAGNTTDAVATAFNAATSAVKSLGEAFSDTANRGEAMLDLLIGGAAGIATAFGGPALGQAVGAVGNFIKSILGDLSNGIAEIQRQIDETASRSTWLGDNLIEGIARSATERVSRGGLLGWLGFTKEELDRDAFLAGVSMAEGIANGLVGTLRSGNFEEAWQSMLDDILIQGIIQSFMATDAIQALIERVMNAVADGNTGQAQTHLSRFKNEFSEIWELIQEVIGGTDELAVNVTGALTSGFTNALNSATWDEAWGKATDNMRATLRDAIVSAFMESAAMKRIFDAFNAALSEALEDGVISDDELALLERLYSQTEGPMKELWDALERLGLGFDDLNETVTTVTSSLSNLPSVFLDTQAMFDSQSRAGNAVIPSPGSLDPSMPIGPEAGIGVPDRWTITIQGDVYGWDDFEQRVNDAVKRGEWRANLGTHGVSQ